MEKAQVILGVDPGHSKCGLAVVGADGRVLARRVVVVQQLGPQAAELVSEYAVQVVALGNSVGSRSAERVIKEHCPGVAVAQVDETMTSQLARQRYWQDNPPRGLWCLVPTSWRVPPRPIDDYAAVVLAERLRREMTSCVATT